jgi:hypothetical protein
MSTTQKKIKATDTMLSTNGYYGDTTSLPASFPQGTSSNVLKGIVTTVGDMICCDNTTNQTIARIPQGANGLVLQAKGSAIPQWVNSNTLLVSAANVVGYTGGSAPQYRLGETITDTAPTAGTAGAITGTTNDQNLVDGSSTIIQLDGITTGLWLIIFVGTVFADSGTIDFSLYAVPSSGGPVRISNAQNTPYQTHSICVPYLCTASTASIQTLVKLNAGATGSIRIRAGWQFQAVRIA